MSELTRITRRKSENFTVIDNTILKDRNLSCKAKAIHTTVMSLPDDWNFSIKGLCVLFIEGERAIRAGMKELIEAGYCKYSKIKTEKGYFIHDYKFFENPLMQNAHVENAHVQNAHLQNARVQNSYINKELIDKELNNQELKNKETNNIFTAYESGEQKTLFSKGSRREEEILSRKEKDRELQEQKENVPPRAIHIGESKGLEVEKPGVKVWNVYKKAFSNRYGVEPVRNAKVNAICAKFGQSLPLEEVEGVVEFYLSHNNYFYVSNAHPLEIMLKDIQKIRMEWFTNRKITKTYVQSVESRDEVEDRAERAYQIYKDRQNKKEGMRNAG